MMYEHQVDMESENMGWVQAGVRDAVSAGHSQIEVIIISKSIYIIWCQERNAGCNWRLEAYQSHGKKNEYTALPAVSSTDTD